jgi:hypothetical protein
MIKPEDVQLMLEDASSQVAEPDLADRVWADARVINRRRRRLTAAVGATAVVALIAAGVVAGPQLKRSNQQVAPSPDPVPSATITVPSTGEIDGVPYWLGPEPGSEPWLDGLPTVLGAELGIPNGRIQDLESRPIRQVAVVLMLQVEPGRYHPLLRSVGGRWAESSIELAAAKDADGNRVAPLSTTSVAPSGSMVAFAQPGKIVVLDTTSAHVEEIPVPSATIDHVAWTTTSDRVMASGPDAAYRVIVGDVTPGLQRVVQIARPADPAVLTPPLALDSDATGETLVSYDANGRGRLVQRPALPVNRWVGSTFSSGGLSARSLVPQPVPRLDHSAQALAVVEADPQSPRKLMVLPDSLKEVREPGSGVLGWYDDHTILFESRTTDAGWILAWNVQNGQLLRVTELRVDAVALGPTLVR